MAKIEGSKMNINILYDYDIFSSQSYGGISRSFVEIFNQFDTSKRIHVLLPFLLSRNSYLRNTSVFQGVTLNTQFRGLTRLLRVLNAMTFIPSLKYGGADVYHQTFYSPWKARLQPDIPLVVTVHDMTPELFPEYFEDATTVHKGKRAVCERASAVVCVSENTKKDLNRLYDIDLEKLHVVPHGGRIAVKPDDEVSVRLPDRYVLYVGKRKGYKNFRELAEALAPIMEQVPDLWLVCVGGGRLTRSELTPFGRFGVRSRVHHNDPTDEEMAAYYKNATLMVYPSLYEGFGLPILEAFQHECPVVASRRSSFPEIAGEAAAYFEPGEEGSLYLSIKRVLFDKSYRQYLIDSGRRRGRQYSWRESAMSLARIYRSIA